VPIVPAAALAPIVRQICFVDKSPRYQRSARRPDFPAHSQLVMLLWQAVWALGNIAGDSPKCRDLVLEAGALLPLLEQLKSTKVSMQRNATWTLSNFCRGKPQPNFEQVLRSTPPPPPSGPARCSRWWAWRYA